MNLSTFVFAATAAILACYGMAAGADDTRVDGRVLDGTNSTVKAGTPGSYEVTYAASEWPNLSIVPPAGTESWDWSAAGALQFTVANPGSAPVELGVRVDDEVRADGVTHCRTGRAAVPPGKTVTFAMTFGPDPMSVGMRGLPVAAGALPTGADGSGPFSLAHIVRYQFFLHFPTAPTTLTIRDVKLAPQIDLDGIVDRFGQYSRADWPGKVHAEGDLAERRTAEEAEEAASPALPGRDRFGGWAEGPRLAASGFFRAEKYRDKWALVTPDGHLFFSLGFDTMDPGGEATFTTGRERMFSWLPKHDDPLARFASRLSGMHSGPIRAGLAFSFYEANLFRKYGDDWSKQWQASALRRLPSWGFNTVGNWSDLRFYRNGRVPYVATAGVGGRHAEVSSGSDYWGKMPDPFDPQFAADAEASLRSVAERVKGDPWCVGYFVDNELSWAGGGEDGGRYGLAYGALAADASASPAKRAFVAQLKASYGDVATFNAAWDLHAASWEALDAPFKPAGASNAARRSDMSTFVKAFARRYFQVVRDALKHHDPDHLYLGCRFAWHGPEEVDAAAELCDVVSFNIYARRLGHEWGYLARLGKPCIIGEFHFGALDRGMFHAGLVSTPSQQARAQTYEDYVGSVLDHPAFVGCHWFQYIDEPLTGRTWDGENYNIGFVDVTDSPYPDMVVAARSIHSKAYSRRFGAASTTH